VSSALCVASRSQPARRFRSVSVRTALDRHLKQHIYESRDGSGQAEQTPSSSRPTCPISPKVSIAPSAITAGAAGPRGGELDGRFENSALVLREKKRRRRYKLR
jgi:hypothetical protein